MTPKLSTDLANALSAKLGEPLQVQGPDGKLFWIMPEQSLPNNYEEWVDQQLKLGVAQADAGLSEPWDSDDIKRQGRRLFEERKKSEG